MLPHPVGRQATDPATGSGGQAPSPGLDGRIVRVALTLYLMPVIVLVLLVGAMAVTSTGLARAAGRLLSGRPDRPVFGVKKDVKSARRAHLASRADRSRSL